MNSREGLLRAALMLFAEKGYEGVSVQEIVAKTGVAKPTLYHFFGSKYGVLEALFEEHATRLSEAVRKAAGYSGDLPLTLDRLVAAYIEFAGREPLFYRLELALYFAPRHSEAHQVAVKYYSQRQAIIEDLFQQAVREHGNFRGRHQRYAVALVGTINSYIALQLDGSVIITDRLRHEIVHQFSHGIYS